MKSGKRRKKKPESYQERSYRRIAEQANLVSSYVRLRETDLHILANRRVEEKAFSLVVHYRNQLENYLASHSDFVQALHPLPPDSLAPPLIREMLSAGHVAGVGPMAAVAGVIAEYVGRDLLASGLDEVIVENGGDIFLARQRDCTVSIFAGESSLSDKIGIVIRGDDMPLGVCCSSATVGHSLSLGKADAVVVVADSTAIADAVATRLGNEVAGQERTALDSALNVARNIRGIRGVVIIVNDRLGAWGQVELTKVSSSKLS